MKVKMKTCVVPHWGLVHIHTARVNTGKTALYAHSVRWCVRTDILVYQNQLTIMASATEVANARLGKASAVQ